MMRQIGVGLITAIALSACGQDAKSEGEPITESGEPVARLAEDWPANKEMWPLVEKALVANLPYQECASGVEFGTGRKVGGPTLNSFSVIEKGSVANDIYPAIIDAEYVCNPAQTFGSPAQEGGIAVKRMTLSFRKDEFGDWQVTRK